MLPMMWVENGADGARSPKEFGDDGDVAELGNTAGMDRAPARNAAAARGDALPPLAAINMSLWRELAGRAIEPNGYYLPEWELAVNALAPGRGDASMLAAWNVGSPPRLTGLLPVVSLWRAYQIPLPALVSAHPYGTLCTPPLDRDAAAKAATRLMRRARQVGARALILRDMSLDGAAMTAISEALRPYGLRPHVLHAGHRACLDATRDGDQVLLEALGARKLKELRRQRHRLAEHGTVVFEVARSREDVGAALETFLALEASGWKGQRGTAMIQREGDASFIRRAAIALAANGQCEVVTLRAGVTPIAAAIVLRHQHRAFYFKLGIDERFAKFSPGVQLTLDLTRQLCADPAITSADSTASPDHPMINPIWRGRLAIGDVLVPLRPGDPMVSLIRAAMSLRHSGLEQARRLVRLIRACRRKR
jgi:CelD/BcsL family acetyltransferase involved in cellulose biosynthesis